MKVKTDLAQRDTLPENFDAIETFWQFWDTHSSADYEDFMETVKVEINLDPRNYRSFSEPSSPG